MMLSNRLAKHFGAAAAAATVVGAANAAVVTWNLNLAVPSTFEGVYLNIATQTTGGTGATTPGFDLNPYGSAVLSMYWGTGTTYVRTQATGGPSSLAVGTVVGASSTFANQLIPVVVGTSVSNGWQLNSANYFGFRFNHDTLGLRYGYGVMQVGANSQDRTLVSISWEDSGGSIVVPAPGAMALLGLAGLAARRRRR
jgi:MYXO-CTERM domain-containing protein